MKKLCKQLAALALSVMLLATLCVPAFATSTHPEDAPQVPLTEGATADVTVGVSNPTDKSANGGDLLLAYKVVDITFDSHANTVTNTFTKLFNDFQDSLEEGNAWKTMTPDEYGKLGKDTPAIKNLLGAFTAYIKVQTDYKTQAEDQQTADKDTGIATFKDMAMGQYIIVGDGTSTAAKIYQTVTAEVAPEIVTDEKTGDEKFVIYADYTVAMKTTTPSIGKDITGGTVEDTTIPDNGDKDNQDTASIGDDVEYTLTVGVPTYPEGSTNTTFYVGDLLSEGLTLNADSFTVTGTTYGDEEELLTPDDDYTLDTTGDAKHTFYMDFDMSKIGTYKTVTIKYTAVLNENAVLGTIEGNPNNVDLIYSNSPFDGITWEPTTPEDPENPRPGEGEDGYHDAKDEEILYTYALAIDKFDKTDSHLKLAGAVFEIYASEDDCTAGKPVIDTITTGKNGVATFVGLKAGTYWLKEITAPTGYNKLEGPFPITINAGNSVYSTIKTTYTYTTDPTKADPNHTTQATIGDVPAWMNADGVLTAAATKPENYEAAYVASVVAEENIVVSDPDNFNGFYMKGVENDKGAQLPSTGGIGTTIFYIIGGCLMLGAVILLVTKRRMSGRE